LKNVKAGVLINPDAGKDVRRLLCSASFVSNFVKIELGKRVVLGLDAAGVDEIYVMHDNSGLGEDVVTALEGRVSSKLDLIPTRSTGTALDTVEASAKMRELGVKSLVVVGGDGTLRAAFKGAPNIPLATVVAGTNNVTGTYYDPTLVGYVAGLVALGKVSMEEGVRKANLLEVFVNGERRDLAVVDVAVLETPYIGAKAILDVDCVKYAVFSKGEPTDVGLASVLGFLKPTPFGSDEGFFIEFGCEGGFAVKAVVMPGLFKTLYVRRIQNLKVGESVRIPPGEYTLALDGEREVEVGRDDEVKIVLSREGPLLIDVVKSLTSFVRSNSQVV